MYLDISPPGCGVIANIVWCGMSEICLKLKVLAKIDFIVFWLVWGSNKPEILGFNFSRPSTSFYDAFSKWLPPG